MAPRRKQQAAEPRQQGREVKLRVPESLMKFIEERAKADRRPINATIVKLLEGAPYWEHMANLDDLSDRFESMFNRAEITFARYSQEIAWQLYSRKLVETVDGILMLGLDAEAESALRGALNELRAIRAEMRIQQRQDRLEAVDRTRSGEGRG
jgi:hypothetical protein